MDNEKAWNHGKVYIVALFIGQTVCLPLFQFFILAYPEKHQ